MNENVFAEVKKLFRDGKYAEAEEQLNAILKETPDDWQAEMLYGTCRLYQRDSSCMQNSCRGKGNGKWNWIFKRTLTCLLLFICEISAAVVCLGMTGFFSRHVKITHSPWMCICLIFYAVSPLVLLLCTKRFRSLTAKKFIPFLVLLVLGGVVIWLFSKSPFITALCIIVFISAIVSPILLYGYMLVSSFSQDATDFWAKTKPVSFRQNLPCVIWASIIGYILFNLIIHIIIIVIGAGISFAGKLF